MKPRTVLTFVLPPLTDKAAAQFTDLLNELIGGIEHHYADQVHHYRKHQQEIRYRRKSPPPQLTDPPF